MLDMCFSFRDKWLAESQLVDALSPGNDIGLYQGYWIAVRYYFLIGGWPKTEGFVVISRSKLNQYQDDLLYVRVRISSHNVFFSSFFFVWYRKIWSTLSIRFVEVCSSRLAGSDNTYTSISYFTVSHPNPLRKLYLSHSGCTLQCFFRNDYSTVSHWSE